MIFAYVAAAVALVGWAVFSWSRRGRIGVYVGDAEHRYLTYKTPAEYRTLIAQHPGRAHRWDGVRWVKITDADALARLS